jgi:hypothetical protein
MTFTGKPTATFKLSLISTRALLATVARTTAAAGAIGIVVEAGIAQAQVAPGGSVTSLGASPSGVTENVTTPSSVGAFAPGSLSVSGGGTTLNIFDGVIPEAILWIGTDGGTGRAVVNDFGTLNVTASGLTSDDAIVTVSGTIFDGAPSQAGTLILGDDPATPGIETTGFMSVTAGDDALLSVGRNGAGNMLMTNLSLSVTALGVGTGSAALLELGGSTIGNAVGSFTATNPNIVVDARGTGASVVSVGRRTNAVTPATAPENTLLL